MKPILWNAAKSKKCLVVPKSYDHKYSRGVLGVITGSAQYPGAAVLSTKAAVATGVFIHDRAARLASKGGSISATSIIDYVPEAIRKILG